MYDYITLFDADEAARDRHRRFSPGLRSSLGQVAVDQVDDHAALADAGGDAPDRSGPYVASGDDAQALVSSSIGSHSSG